MRKLTYEEVKDYIESHGIKLLSKEYVSARSKLKLQCPAGHIYSASYDNFKKGKRCPYCNGGSKFDYRYVKSYIENFGYKLLTEKYKTSIEKLKIECPKGHIFEMSFNSFKNQGHGCPKCQVQINSENLKNNYKEVKKYVTSNNYKLLSNEYKNNREPLKLQCPEDHICYISYGNFKNGRRCPICADIKREKQPHKLKNDEVKNYIESFGYTLLSKYKNAHDKLRIKCPNGHVFEKKYNKFQQGGRCPICYYQSTSSQPEKEIQNFVSAIYNGEIKPNDRDTIINPLTGYNLELDIYLPEVNKAIEFNGVYGHSLPNNDNLKKKQCRNINVDLLVIEEENWENNKEICLQAIENFINKSK